MLRKITHLFNAHPATVDETYFEHLRFASGFALSLMGAGFAAAVHALLPFMFEKTAGNIINRLHHRMHNRQT